MGKHSTDMITQPVSLMSPLIIADIEDVTVILYRRENGMRWSEYYTGLKPVSHAFIEGATARSNTAVYFIPDEDPGYACNKFECPRVWTDDGIAVGFEYL